MEEDREFSLRGMEHGRSINENHIGALAPKIYLQCTRSARWVKEVKGKKVKLKGYAFGWSMGSGRVGQGSPRSRRHPD